jgi:hypothetical protein
MDNDEVSESGQQKKFKVTVGENVAYVEIISFQNKICSVEIPGRAAIFVTRIRGKNNKPCWISIPQGDDEIALIVGDYIDEHIYSKSK